jgi:ribonuclease-3
VLGVPEYHVDESGPDHQKSFRATVRVGGHVYGSGEGRSKKEAEQQAAETAWNAISNGEGPVNADETAGGTPAPAAGHAASTARGQNHGRSGDNRAASGTDGPGTTNAGHQDRGSPGRRGARETPGNSHAGTAHPAE